jgi:arylsulfatase A-like enzyme
MEFTNSFVTNPLCCPSRSSFLTGQYAHDHGIWTNHAPEGGATAFNDSSTLPMWLQDAGYTTGAFGKYLNDYLTIISYVPPGWDEWHSHAPQYAYLYKMNDNGVVTRYNATEADYSTDVLRDKAVDFIKNTDEPFFMWFTPDAPHLSPTGYAVPAKRHVGTCEDIQARPPSYYEADASDKPEWVRNLAPAISNTTTYTDKVSKSQVCSLKAVDEAVDAIMDALGPRLDNTIIIFTSDNGYAWGEHRWNSKTCEFEECIRVPLAIRYPSLIEAGSQSDALVLNLDLTATILDLAEATPGLQQRGQSLVPLFADPSTTDWRQDFLIEQARFPDAATLYVPGFTGFRAHMDKYVSLETGEIEYYDLVNDPYELNNLAYDPAYADIILQKQQRLAEIVEETYS